MRFWRTAEIICLELQDFTAHGMFTLERKKVLSGNRAPGREVQRKGQEIRYVLLVEDHVAFREALATFLNQKQDLEVVAQVGSLAEGKSILPDSIDVAVIDIYLPDGNGLELVREMRQAKPQLGILVLTGSLDLASEAFAKDVGADEVLYKATGIVEIADAIQRVIARRAS